MVSIVLDKIYKKPSTRTGLIFMRIHKTGLQGAKALGNNCIKEPAENNLIVVVDDSDIIAESIKTFLGMSGYGNVAVFNNPTNALHEIRHGTCPAVIITDFEMPGMNGLELLDAATAVHPRIIGVIITGNPSRVLTLSDKYKVFVKGTGDFFKSLIHFVQTNVRV